MTALATLASDWPTALEAASARLARRPGDEGAITALSVALSELGREDEARDLLARQTADHNGAALRAAARFYHHVDEPDGMQAALDALPRIDAALTLALGEAWRRHAEFDRAISAAERVLAGDPANRGAQTLKQGSLSEQRVLSGAWRPPPRTCSLAPVRARVLHMLQRSLPHHRSGSTYRTDYTVRAQAQMGLDPHVLTQPGFGGTPGSTGGEGVIHHRLAALPAGTTDLDARLVGYVDAASTVIERVRPAVLHPASDFVNALAALELGERYGLPVVYEVRGFPEELRGRWAGSRTTYEKALWRRQLEVHCWHAADRVVTLAEVMKAHIVAHGVDPSRVVVVPNAVDPAVFQPVAADPRLRARLGIEPGDLVVGYVSTLVSYEGLPFLVEAVARLTARGHRVRALIVGDGNQREAVRLFARRLGVGDRVILTGPVGHDEVRAYYELLDVFVVPRTDEVTSHLVTPLKPYEAMATGRAVVVSRTAALKEMVIDGETGLTFTPEDAQDLARVLESLLLDPGRRAALGRRARRWVAEHRTWEANARRYLRIYEELDAV